MANSCSRDCATTESRTIPFWKRRYLKQRSQAGRARQAHGVLSRVSGCSYTTQPFLGPQLSSSHPHFHTAVSAAALDQNHKVTVILSPTSLSVQREGGKPSQKTDPCPGCVPVVRMVGPSRKKTPRKGHAETMEKTWQYCTTLAKAEL